MLMHSMRSKNTETAQHNAPNPFNEQPKRRLTNKAKRRALIIGAVVVVLGVGAWLAWPAIGGFFGLNQPKDDDTSQLPDIDPATERKLVIQDELVERLQSGGSEEAQAYLDEQLETASTDEEKSFILINKSTVASGNPGQALDYAQQAEEIEATYTSASALASLYEQSGDSRNALKYYRLMLERMPENFQETNPDDYATILKKIKVHEDKLGG